MNGYIPAKLLNLILGTMIKGEYEMFALEVEKYKQK
jgi:hypothetical protein